MYPHPLLNLHQLTDFQRRPDGMEVVLYEQVIIHVSMERRKRIMKWVKGFFLHKRIISAVKRVEFDSDGMSYIILGSGLL
jgi:hypothetical protein